MNSQVVHPLCLTKLPGPVGEHDRQSVLMLTANGLGHTCHEVVLVLLK